MLWDGNEDIGTCWELPWGLGVLGPHWGEQQPQTHLLLQPLPLLLDLLLQGLAELLHLLLMLGHTPGGHSKAGGGSDPAAAGAGPWDPPIAHGTHRLQPVCQGGFAQQGRVQQSQSGTFVIPCVTVEGAQPQTSSPSKISAMLKAPRFLLPWVHCHGWGSREPHPCPRPSRPSPWPWGDSLVQSLLQSLLLAPGFLDAVPHLGQKLLQVSQELGFVLPELHPELPDLLSAGRGCFVGIIPPGPPNPGWLWGPRSFSSHRSGCMVLRDRRALG